MKKTAKRTTTLSEEVKKWYKKLKDSGFEDIEHPSGHLKNNRNMVSLSSRHGHPDAAFFTDSLENQMMNDVSNKIEYFILASKMTHDYPFKDKIQAFIWANHAEGDTLKEIKEKLEAKFNKKWSLKKIWTIIKNIAAAMPEYAEAEEIAKRFEF